MSVPMRKDEPDDEYLTTEQLTTADLAQSKRAAGSEERRKEDRMRPVLAEPISGERVESVTSIDTANDTFRTGSDVRNTSTNTPLFPNTELQELRSRWSDVQTAFVDEPRRAVEQADGLVASAMKRLAEVFAEERSKLEQQWDRGDNVSTEELRIALQRYRSFFHRLLSI